MIRVLLPRGRGAFLLLALALVLAACGGGGGPDPHRAPTGLVVGAGEDVSPSGAFQARLGVYPLNVNVAETLTRLTPDFRVEPLLATRWEYVGRNTWRFHLRPGVRFHDGSPLDARAVQWSITEGLRGGFGYGGLTENSVRVVGDSTVEITTTEPDLRLPERLVHPNYSIFAPGSEPGVRPVGTGPFRFVEYRPGQRLVVERNPEYWGEPARPDRITFRFFPDPTTRVLALLAGEVDLIVDLPREQVEAVSRHPDLKIARAPVGQVLNLHVNAHGHGRYELLRDPALRRAIALSIDREQLVRRVWGGEGTLVQNMTVPAILGPSADRVRPFAHDPGSARELLERAGWRLGPDGTRHKDDRRLRLVLISSPAIDAGTVEFLQSELRRVGIDARWVRVPDSGSYADRLNSGEFHLDLSAPNQNDGDPLFLPTLVFYSGSERPFARWHHVGERFDRLVEAGLGAEDPDEARRLAAEAIRIAVSEETVVVPVAGRFRLYAMKAGVQGFAAHPSQTNQSWATLSLDPE